MFDSSRGVVVFVVTLVLVVLATAFVAARLVSKWWITKRKSADDYFAVLAWVFCVGLSTSILIGVRYGLGELDVGIAPTWTLPLKRCIYAFSVFYNPALMATKTAILLLYIRMAAAHPFLRYASIGTLCIVNLAGFILTFLNLFQCRPVRAAYTGEPGTCLDLVALYLSTAPINILTDLAILLLPLPILTSLRMEFRQKVVLVATFIVGGFVTIVDIIRIVYLQDALQVEYSLDPSGSITATKRPPNFTFYASFSLMWSAVEVSVGLMCACTLVLKPLVLRVVPSILRTPQQIHLTRQQRERTAQLSASQQVTPPKSSSSGGVDSEGRAKTPDSFALTDTSATKEPRSPASATGFFLPTIDEHGASSQSRASSSFSSQYPAPPMAPTGPVDRRDHNEDAEEDDDDERGMDFFQMLASDPPAGPPAVTPMSPRMNVIAPTPQLVDATAKPPPSPTSPIMRRLSRVATRRMRRATVSSQRTEPGQGPTQTFFDFVNMGGRKPLTELTAKEAWGPVMFVSILFFLWGFAYGLLGTLNAEIQTILNYPPSRTIALHNAYWLAYFFGPPLLGYWTLTRQSFRATFIWGLSIYAIGAMAFWPSSVLRSFPGFFISNFIIAFGLSLLEVAANPFIALAGPGELSEARLLFSQGIQGIGSIASPILAYKGLFNNLKDVRALFNVQWCYLAVSLFVVVLAVVFFYVPLSEADDDDLQAASLQRLYNANLESDSTIPLLPCLPDTSFIGRAVPIRLFLPITGGLVVFLYCGAQESLAYFWTPIVHAITPGQDAFWAQAISHAVFAFSRFLASFCCWMGVPPRLVLLVFLVGAFICSLLSMLLPPGKGTLAALILLVFFEAPMFPMVFAMSLRGQGKHTKLVSSYLVSSISGATLWPSVAYGIDKAHPADPRYNMSVTVAMWGASCLWPLWLCAEGRLGRWIDPRWSRSSLPGGAEGQAGGSVVGGKRNGLAGLGTGLGINFAGGMGDRPMADEKAGLRNVEPRGSASSDGAKHLELAAEITVSGVR